MFIVVLNTYFKYFTELARFAGQKAEIFEGSYPFYPDPFA
jgi:hypothetical protein